MKYFLFTYCLTFHLITGLAQESSPQDYLRFDFQLVVENDAFTLDLSQDQYYSSGIYPAVRWLIDSAGKTKVIRSVQLNHRVFTPSRVGWRNEALLDRPYAGQLSASVANEYYFHTNQYLKVQLEIGWMGPSVRVGETQAAWHRWFGMPTPMGWKFQINNSPIVNGYMSYVKPLYSSYHFELSGESNLGLGTVFNYVRQDLMLRMGKLKPLYESSYAGASPGQKKRGSSGTTTESYFFYAPGFEYVIYNATIEGNLIGNRSAPEHKQLHKVWQHRAGVMFSWPRFDFGLTAYWRSPENEKATRHKYVAIRMNQRF